MKQGHSKNKNPINAGDINWIYVSLAWSLFIISFGGYSIFQLKNYITENAIIEAETNIDKDIAYRRWVSDQGGFYVAPTEKSPPNPYLNVPERDVVTTDGMQLTLVNPAYMTRLVHENAAQLYGVRGRLTSLKPLRPENKPDAWEEIALKELEKGIDEVTDPAVDIDGKMYLRQIRKFVTEKSCLKCHADQGYSEGDVR